MTTFCAPKYRGNDRLDGKTVIITGCNTGIGKYNALDFCRRGGRVVMACRSVDKAEEAKKDILDQLRDEENIGELVIKRLDLSSLQSVRECAQEIMEKEPRIDLLINNAGIMMIPKELTEDGYEKQLATNHLGHFLFTLLLLPRIISSAPARIVNLSSYAHQLWGDNDFEDVNYDSHEYSPSKAYGRSKLANILFTKELAKRLQGKNVNVYAVHPGAVDTELQRNVDDAYFKGSKRLVKAVLGWTFRTPEQGAQTTVYCALDEKAGQETGEYYSNCKKTTPTADARNTELAKKLWDISVELVKLQDYDPFNAKDEGPKIIESVRL